MPGTQPRLKTANVPLSANAPEKAGAIALNVDPDGRIKLNLSGGFLRKIWPYMVWGMLVFLVGDRARSIVVEPKNSDIERKVKDLEDTVGSLQTAMSNMGRAFNELTMAIKKRED